MKKIRKTEELTKRRRARGKKSIKLQYRKEEREKSILWANSE